MRRQRQVYTHEKEIDRLNAGLRAFYLEYELQKGKTVEELAIYIPGSWQNCYTEKPEAPDELRKQRCAFRLSCTQ